MMVPFQPAQFAIEHDRRAVRQLAESFQKLAGVKHTDLGPFTVAGESYFLPRLEFRGPNSADPIRIGLFAVLHGDEPAGALAALECLAQLASRPELAESFLLHVYPLCNPTGFEDGTRLSRGGLDLNREFWRDSTAPEVRLLEHELRHGLFHGIIQFHADDTSAGLYGFVRGHTLTENLLRPALAVAERFLPRNLSSQIDGFAARDGIIYEQYEGILAAPAEMASVPFEIVLETPALAPLDRQVAALVMATQTILSEYRKFIAFAQDI